MKLVPTVLGNQIESEKRTWKDIKKGFTHFAEGDVAIAKITPCFQNRKSVVMRNLINGFGAGTTELHIFRSINEQIIPEYVLLFLKTPKFIFDGVGRMTGSAGQKRVPKTYFSENPFPLPPLNEQKRIVAKVDQLMALCDKLETKLSQSQSDCDELLTAIVVNIENDSVEKPRIVKIRKANKLRTEEKKTSHIKKHINTPEKKGTSTSKSQRNFKKLEKRFDKSDVLVSFRKAIFRQNNIDELTLLRLTGQRLRIKRLSQPIRHELESHINTAIRRKILYRDGDGYCTGAPTIEHYDDDFLIKVLRSVTRKGWEYHREHLVKESANYLGFDKVSDAFKDRMKSIFRKAIRQKALYRKGAYFGKV